MANYLPIIIRQLIYSQSSSLFVCINYVVFLIF